MRRLKHWNIFTWWRHQMETFSALLAIGEGNSPVTGEFSAQRPVTQSSDVFFDLPLNKRLCKQSWSWWFETPSRPLWRHCNDIRHIISTLYRLVWLLVLLGVMFFMIATQVIRVTSFLDKPKSVNLEVDYEKELAFPAITICNTNTLR